MPHLADLIEELERSEPARAAMALLQGALDRRTADEQDAFWRAIDLYYVSRKAPPEASAPPKPVAAADVPAATAAAAP